MLVPDLFIGGCGTQMFSFDGHGKPIADEEWLARLGKGWEKAAVKNFVESSSELEKALGPISQVPFVLCIESPRLLYPTSVQI